MHDNERIEMQQGNDGPGRREFLKKAGAVAWIVPTLQVLNVTSAAAGTTNGSVVITTPPPVDDRRNRDAG